MTDHKRRDATWPDQNIIKEFFEYKEGILYWRVKKGTVNPGDIAGTIFKTCGYRYVTINNKTIAVHHVVWIYHYGYKPIMLDHINRNKLDNRIENLRECNQSQNLSNMIHKKETSNKYKGVSKFRNKWRARIKNYGKEIHLGVFKCEHRAAIAYNKAAIKIHGEFALLNKIRGTRSAEDRS